MFSWFLTWTLFSFISGVVPSTLGYAAKCSAVLYVSASQQEHYTLLYTNCAPAPPAARQPPKRLWEAPPTSALRPRALRLRKNLLISKEPAYLKPDILFCALGHSIPAVKSETESWGERGSSLRLLERWHKASVSLWVVGCRDGQRADFFLPQRELKQLGRRDSG